MGRNAIRSWERWKPRRIAHSGSQEPCCSLRLHRLHLRLSQAGSIPGEGPQSRGTPPRRHAAQPHLLTTTMPYPDSNYQRNAHEKDRHDCTALKNLERYYLAENDEQSREILTQSHLDGQIPRTYISTNPSIHRQLYRDYATQPGIGDLLDVQVCGVVPRRYRRMG